MKQSCGHLVEWLDRSTHKYSILAVITVLALILRFYKLGEWSFWIDEVYTLNRIQAHYSSFTAILENIPPYYNWFPTSLIMMAGVINLLGVSEWSLRLVPALIGTLSVPLLYFIVRRFFPASVALISALLLAVSPWHLFWSQNGRFYTTLMLFYTLALWTAYRGLEKNRPLYLVLSLIFLYLALSERMIAFLLFPVLVAFVLSVSFFRLRKPRGMSLRNISILLIPFVTAVVIECCSLLFAGRLYLLGDIFYEIFLGSPIDDPFRLAAFIGFNIGLPLVALALVSGISIVLQRDRLGIFVFLGAIVPIVLVLATSSFVFAKDRYVLVTLPCWIILASLAVVEASRRLRSHSKWLSAGILGMLLANAFGADLLYYQINHGHRRDWRSAFALIKEHRRPGDRVLSTRPALGKYYLGEDVGWMGEASPDLLRSGDTRTWFVADSESVWVTGPVREFVESHSQLVNVWTLRVPEDVSLRLYLYDPDSDN